MVNKQAYITRFQELHKRKQGEDISDVAALEYFENLICLVKAVYRPIPIEVIKGGNPPYPEKRLSGAEKIIRRN